MRRNSQTSEEQIIVCCASHPELTKPEQIPVSHRHRYSPSAIEAEIIRHCEDSTKALKGKFEKNIINAELNAKVNDFLDSRDSLLRELRESSAVITFLQYILGLESQVEGNIEAANEERELEQILEDESEEVKIEEERAPETIKADLKEFDNLLDAIRASIVDERSINSGKGKLEQSIEAYVNKFLDLLNWLVDQRLQTKKFGLTKQQLQELISEVMSCDILYLADKNGGSEVEAIAIPLDVSPLRIALSTLLCETISPEAKNWNRMFAPPIFTVLKMGVPVLMKPYRSLDNHPILIRIAQYNNDPEKFQEETKRTIGYFKQITDPLIDRIKSLTPYGKRGTQPSFIRNNLVKGISLYLEYNPFSVENVRVVDLGCGSGGLVKDAYTKLLKEKTELASSVFISTLLNDIINFPGSSLRNVSETEEFAGKLDIQIREGDIRDLIVDAYSKREHYDIAFINRVFDIFGGYGVFLFERKDLPQNQNFCGRIGTKELIPNELDHRVVAFHEYGSFSSYCRAIAFLLNLSVDISSETAFLPAVEMNAYKNFFSFAGKKGTEILSNLLDICEVVFISVFPGSYESLLPNKEGLTVFPFELVSENTYSIILISKNREIIDYMKKNWMQS